MEFEYSFVSVDKTMCFSSACETTLNKAARGRWELIAQSESDRNISFTFKRLKKESPKRKSKQ